MLEIVKNVVYMIGVLIGSICLSVSFEWSELTLWMFLVFCFALSVIIGGWMDRYERKGKRRLRKRRFEEAALYFCRSYEYYEGHAWAETWRRWLWPFWQKGAGQEMAAAGMLQCYLDLGQREKALECIKELKERWPEGLAGKAEFSFLEVLEDGNYQEFQRENEEQMRAALEGLLSPGEELELCFYGITDRRGRVGRRWKKSPGFVGITGNDLLFAALKRPAMEEAAWTERYPLKVSHVKKKMRFLDWCTFEIRCENGDQLKIQCLKMLKANQYAGQEENIRRFEQALRLLAGRPDGS